MSEVLEETEDAYNIEEIYMSKTLTKLAPALNKVQAVVMLADKNQKNGHYNDSPFSDIKACWAACNESLSKNGFSIVQTHRPSVKGELRLMTMLLHESGEWIKGLINMPISKPDPHGYVGGTTYARRTALCAMVGICPSDDDGNGATFGKEPTKKRASGGTSKKNNKKTDTKENKTDSADTSTDEDF